MSVGPGGGRSREAIQLGMNQAVVGARAQEAYDAGIQAGAQAALEHVPRPQLTEAQQAARDKLYADFLSTNDYIDNNPDMLTAEEKAKKAIVDAHREGSYEHKLGEIFKGIRGK